MVRIGLILFLFPLLFCESFCAFKTDFLGDYLSDAEYNNRTLCWTQVCMEDSDRLIDAADHDSFKTEPCDDFKTFAMGNFFEHRVLNERYTFTGFDLEINLQFAERQKRMMKKPVDQNDPKMFKVIKTFFKKCINSSIIENHGTNDIFAYLRRIGNYQFTRDGTTDIEKFIKGQPDLSIRLFFDYEMSYYKNGSQEYLAMGLNYYWTYSEDWELNGIVGVLSSLLVDKETKFEVVKGFVEYLQIKKTVQDMWKLNTKDSEVIKIKKLYEKYPSKYLDWLQIINNQLLIESQRTLEDEIIVFNPKLTEGLYKLFLKLDDKIIANAFAGAFITTNSRTFTPYIFPKEEARIFGTKRTKQRFEQCLAFLQTHMRPAVEALNAVSLYDSSVQRSATELVAHAVNDSIRQINENQLINNETKKLMTEKLKSIKLWVMFPDDILNITKIDGLYKELDLNGSETFVDMFIELSKFDRKLETKPQDSWIKILRKIIKNDFTFYFIDDNILNVPVKYTLYPYFHPNRSRFFNQVTLYTSTLYGMNGVLGKTFSSKLDKAVIGSVLPNEIMPDESYVRWEANGGIDLQLPSFKLTNRQMLWVCMANRNALKYHKSTPKNYDTKLRILNKYMHVYYKRFPNFREAFQCGNNITKSEQRQLIEMNQSFADANRLLSG